MSVDLLVDYWRAGTLWVAVTGSRGPGVVGFACASVVDGNAHLDQISVAGAVMGRQVGRALIAAVEDWARSLGYTTLTLTTFRDVEFNGPYYRRRGFADLDESAWGPQLRAIREHEIERGIDVAPRVAMAKAL